MRILFVGGLLTLLAACSQDAGEAAPRAGLTAAATAPKTSNDLADNGAHRTLKIPGESFTLTVDYFRTAYDAAKWRTLAAKDVSVSVHVRPAAGRAPEVVLGSFRAQTALRAVDPGLDGLPIAVTEDRPPAAVAGFLMSASYPYDTVVPVEGFSAPLVQCWSFLAGDQPLTEQAPVTAGVYANRIAFT